MKKSNVLWSATIWYTYKGDGIWCSADVEKTKEYKTYNGLMRYIRKNIVVNGAI